MPTQSRFAVSFRFRRLLPAVLAAMVAALLLALLPAVVANAFASPEAQELLASDRAAGDRFGAAVSLAANTALVGAYRDDDACPSDPACDPGPGTLPR